MAGKPKLIKVRLTNRGEDAETPWAHDLGPAPGGGRRVRLANVPFMHAKPTWGDVIVVVPDDDGTPTWDRRGVAFDKIDTRIAEDGKRWAMIVDYEPHPGDKTGSSAFEALARACAEHEIVCEGAWAPRAGEPGRAYLAVPAPLDDVQVMARLRDASLPCELVQIHPRPVKPAPARRRATKRGAKAAARPAAKNRKR